MECSEGVKGGGGQSGVCDGRGWRVNESDKNEVVGDDSILFCWLWLSPREREVAWALFCHHKVCGGTTGSCKE